MQKRKKRSRNARYRGKQSGDVFMAHGVFESVLKSRLSGRVLPMFTTAQKSELTCNKWILFLSRTFLQSSLFSTVHCVVWVH